MDLDQEKAHLRTLAGKEWVLYMAALLARGTPTLDGLTRLFGTPTDLPEIQARPLQPFDERFTHASLIHHRERTDLLIEVVFYFQDFPLTFGDLLDLYPEYTFGFHFHDEATHFRFAGFPPRPLLTYLYTVLPGSFEKEGAAFEWRKPYSSERVTVDLKGWRLERLGFGLRHSE